MQITTFQTGRQDAEHDRVELVDLSQNRKLLGSHTFIETFPILLPDGREWVGSLWQTPTRRSGRRIQVRDEHGSGLFDTDDCYDQANAANALTLWLQEQISKPEAEVEVVSVRIIDNQSPVRHEWASTSVQGTSRFSGLEERLAKS